MSVFRLRCEGFNALCKDCLYFCFLLKSSFICYCNTQLSFWSVIVLYPEIWPPCYNRTASECIQGGSQNEWQELIMIQCPQDVKLRVSGTSVLRHSVPLMTKHAKKRAYLWTCPHYTLPHSTEFCYCLTLFVQTIRARDQGSRPWPLPLPADSGESWGVELESSWSWGGS